jgi:membrane fusion protein (multidrug efflux system)
MVLGVAGCDSKTAATEGGKNAPPVSVVVSPVKAKTVTVYSEFTARTDASDTVDIRARVPAYLEAMHFKEGSLVKKGQVLFTLDERQYEAELQEAKAHLAKAESDLKFAQSQATVETAKSNLDIAIARLNKADQDVKRLKPLAATRAVPQQDYDNALAEQQGARADVEARKSQISTTTVGQTSGIEQAQAAIASSKAAIQQAELNLEYCNITTPIAGIVGKREVAPGNLVGRGDATLLTSVSNVNPLRVFLSISEAEYLNYMALKKEGKLKGGVGEVELVLANGSTFPYKGRITVADRAVDLKTGTLTLIAEFPNPENLIRPGQFGRVRFGSRVVEGALLVPQKAVTELQSAKVIYVVGEDNKVQLRNVALGDRVGEDYIVTDGVKAGEKVIVEGIIKVRPGVTVQASSVPTSIENRN